MPIFKTINESGSANFSGTLSGLAPATTYYMRAYADNSVGISYSNELTFSPPLEGEVFSPTTGRVWMDRNLGASRVATSINDKEAYGDLFQWGRAADGYEKCNSLTTALRSSGDTPGHDRFIISNGSAPNWRTSQSINLWQGVDGINNPCPAGFRIPTQSEWIAFRCGASRIECAPMVGQHLAKGCSVKGSSMPLLLALSA
jgi:uncharacterized protein (TIGR02145 family)